MHGLRFSANVAFLWPEIDDPFERLMKAAEAGFKRVERTFVHDLDAQKLRSALEETGLEMSLFDAFPGDWNQGDRGLLAIPGRESECRRSIRDAIETARTLGTNMINVLGGVLPGEVTVDVALSVASKNLTACASLAHAEGVSLLVEPINTIDVPGYAFPTIALVTELVERVDHPAVGVQFDTYHVAKMGNAILSEVESARAQIRHVQVADMPGRHEPGTGSLPLEEFFALLGDSFGGVVGLEYHPRRSTNDSLQWLPRSSRG